MNHQVALTRILIGRKLLGSWIAESEDGHLRSLCGRWSSTKKERGRRIFIDDHIVFTSMTSIDLEMVVEQSGSLNLAKVTSTESRTRSSRSRRSGRSRNRLLLSSSLLLLVQAVTILV